MVYVSQALMERGGGATGDRADFLDHGVDLDHFRPAAATRPPTWPGSPHPRLGFFGAIDDYIVDLELLERVAGSCPMRSSSSSGPRTATGRLTRLPNVHWLGAAPYEVVPSTGPGSTWR